MNELLSYDPTNGNLGVLGLFFPISVASCCASGDNMEQMKEIGTVKEELLKGLTEEQVAKVKACKSQEEMLKIAKEEGIELTDEQLEAVSGGCGTGHGSTWFTGGTCPICGSINTKTYNGTASHGATKVCFDCGYDSLRV